MRRIGTGARTALLACAMALALAIGGVAPARAAAFTLTTTGRITSGFDAGVFGVNGDLRGRPYAMTQTFDLADLETLESFLPGEDRQRARYSLSTARVTVNGVTHSLTFQTLPSDGVGWNDLLLESGINPATGAAFGYDQLAASQIASFGTINQLAQQLIQSQTVDFLPGSQLDQTLGFAPMPGLSVFANASFFEFTAPGEGYGYAFYADASPIPAPPGVGVFGTALAGLAARRRGRWRRRYSTIRSH